MKEMKATRVMKVECLESYLTQASDGAVAA